MPETRPPFDMHVLIREQGRVVEPTLRALIARPEALDVLPDLTRQAPILSELQSWATQHDIPLAFSGEHHPFARTIPFADLFTICPPRVLELLDEDNVVIQDDVNGTELVTFGDIVTAMQVARDEQKEIDDLSTIMGEADRLINRYFPDLGAPAEPTQLILLYQREVDHFAGYQGKINGTHIIFVHAPMHVPSLSHNPWRSREYYHPTYDNYALMFEILTEERAHQVHAERKGQHVFWYPIMRDEETLTDNQRPYSFRELFKIERTNVYVDSRMTAIYQSDLIMINSLVEALGHAVSASCMLGFAQEVDASTDRRKIKQEVGRMLRSIQSGIHEPEYGIAFHIIHNAQRQGMSLQQLVSLILDVDLKKFYQMDPASPEMQSLITNPSLLRNYVE